MIERAISPFPTVFSALLVNFPQFSSNLKLLSANSFSLDEPKFCHLGKGLPTKVVFAGSVDQDQSAHTLLRESYYVFFFFFSVIMIETTVNFLPNDKILDLSRLKAFADNKSYVVQKSEFLSSPPVVSNT